MNYSTENYICKSFLPHRWFTRRRGLSAFPPIHGALWAHSIWLGHRCGIVVYIHLHDALPLDWLYFYRIVYAMRETLEKQLLNRIDRKRGDVFLRADFANLGGYDQVGRALLRLVQQGRLLKIGYGLYSRSVKSPFDDRPIPPKGLLTLREALKRSASKPCQAAPCRITTRVARHKCRQAAWSASTVASAARSATTEFP